MSKLVVWLETGVMVETDELPGKPPYSDEQIKEAAKRKFRELLDSENYDVNYERWEDA